jgi:hypothetical protein
VLILVRRMGENAEHLSVWNYSKSCSVHQAGKGPRLSLWALASIVGGSSFADAMVGVGVAFADEDDEPLNAGFGTTTLGNDKTSKQVVRYVESGREMIALQLPSLASYLKATVLPPEEVAGGQGWSYDDRRWTLSEYETCWTFGHVDEFIRRKHDSSNIFRRESSTRWYIRFGDHECRVPHSDGIDMLSVLLLHPDGMSADRICKEIGLGIPGTAAISSDLEGRSLELAELAKRSKEFKQEMELTSERPRYEDDEYADPYEIPNTVWELIKELTPVPERLAKAAKNNYAKAKLRSSGIPHSGSEQIEGTFEELVAKMRRCETLIRDLRDMEQLQRAAERETALDGGNPVLKRRVSLAIRNAISAITQRNQHIGAYFRVNFRTDNLRFVMKIATHWRVDYGPNCDFSTRSSTKKADVGDI